MSAQGFVRSLAPVAPGRAALLILGSMPGVRSLEAGQYYAHSRNQFWPMVFSLFELRPPMEYGERIAFLTEKRIALWDVLESCYRDGSADASIRGARPNDIPALIAARPELRAIAFNGTAAARLFGRLIGKEALPRAVELLALPSTSPAHAASSFEQKREKWLTLLKYL